MSSESEPLASPRSTSRGFLSLLRDIAVIIVIAVVVSFLIKTFLVRSFYIPSGSMEQTLQVNDRILVDELTPVSAATAGDVVVFRDPGGWLSTQPATEQSIPVQILDWVLTAVGISAADSKDHLIKRVIGIGGDHVVCCNALGQTTVNGAPLDERVYLDLDAGQTAPNRVEYDITVPEGSLWVLGDNRDHSKDSRFNTDQPGAGFVPVDNVVGRAFWITWPFDRFSGIDAHHEVFAGVPEAAR